MQDRDNPISRKNSPSLDSAMRRHSMVGHPYLWKLKRAFQIQFLINAGLTSQHYLLDIGCGTLRGGLPIIQYLEKGHYFGIESRNEVLDEGRKELRDANLDKDPVLIATENISSVKLPRKFDYIWAFSVLIHMSDNILNDCFGVVRAHLAADGCFYANVNMGDRADGSWQGFPVVYRSLAFYQEVAARNDLRIVDMGHLKNLGHFSGVSEQDEQRMLFISKT